MLKQRYSCSKDIEACKRLKSKEKIELKDAIQQKEVKNFHCRKC